MKAGTGNSPAVSAGNFTTPILSPCSVPIFLCSNFIISILIFASCLRGSGSGGDNLDLFCDAWMAGFFEVLVK